MVMHKKKSRSSTHLIYSNRLPEVGHWLTWMPPDQTTHSHLQLGFKSPLCHFLSCTIPSICLSLSHFLLHSFVFKRLLEFQKVRGETHWQVGVISADALAVLAVPLAAPAVGSDALGVRHFERQGVRGILRGRAL